MRKYEISTNEEGIKFMASVFRVARQYVEDHPEYKQTPFARNLDEVIDGINEILV